jgi:hypothetical protein
MRTIYNIYKKSFNNVNLRYEVCSHQSPVTSQQFSYCLLPSACCLLLFTLFLSETRINAQTPIKKEVDVVKPYEPAVSDAHKIDVFPAINDSVVIKPTIQYNINPVMINTEYQVSAISAAKMTSMPISKLYKSYIKLGIGNYTTPLAEICINSARSKKYTGGVFFGHQSSSGKLKLENGDKVFAGYSETAAELFGKKYLKNAFLYANGRLQGNTVYDYGYYPELDTVLEKGNIRQNYFLASVSTGVKSMNLDSSKLTYDLGLMYNFFQDRVKHGENNIDINAKFQKLYKGFLVGLNTNFDLLKRNAKLDSSKYANSVFMLDPWMGLSSNEYHLFGGLKIYFPNEDNTLKPSFIPYAEFQFTAVKDVLIPYVGVGGHLDNHSYHNIAFENPFITPTLLVKNSVTRSMYGGVKGSLGAKASYIIKVDFSHLKDHYFYVNDTASVLRNTFTVVYDNGTMFNGYAEMNYDYSELLSFGLKANYYDYNLEHEKYAWHKPNFDLTFSTNYNLRNKILVNFDIVAVGKRYAKEFSVNQPDKVLSGTIDFNLGIEYRYTKILSAWLKLNNITASKYYKWNQYPTQRFNAMAGITYSL